MYSLLKEFIRGMSSQQQITISNSWIVLFIMFILLCLLYLIAIVAADDDHFQVENCFSGWNSFSEKCDAFGQPYFVGSFK